jgi:hypothetical protein
MTFSGTAGQVLRKLEAYKLKDEGNGQFRCNSPYRTGSNSQSFVVTIKGNEEGVFCDHADGDRGGSLYQLARHLGIEPSPKSIEVADTKRAYKGIADYAAAHGVPVDVLTKSGWREVDYQKRPALEFKTDTGNRWRFLDGGKPHYISPRHYKRCWYGLKTQTAKMMLQGFHLQWRNFNCSRALLWCSSGGNHGRRKRGNSARIIGSAKRFSVGYARSADHRGNGLRSRW